MNKQEILSQLQALDGKVPYDALRAAIAQREAIIPELLQIVEQVTANLNSLLEKPDYLGHIYAIYLLAQFRETSAYPVIVNFFSGTPGLIAEVTDTLIDKLGRVLASVCGGDDRLIKSLIENEAADEYARSSAVEGLVHLVVQGYQSRDEVIAYFKTLFRTLKRDGENRVWDSLVTEATNLHPEELYEDIKQAIAEDLVSPMFISLERVEIQLAVSKERVIKRLPQKYHLIDDAIQESEESMYFSDTPEHMEILNVMAGLTAHTDVFPHEALTQAAALRDKIIPKLLIDLESAEASAHELLKQENAMWHIFPLYLLAQFREQRAYPLMINFFSLPGEISLDITGDVVTEDLPRLLACVYDGDDAPLQELIEDSTVNEYVRNAALRTYVVLVANQQKSREEVMAYFQSLFRGKLERQLSHIWGGLISCCLDLYPEEVYEDIQQAYADNLVEEFFVGLQEVQKVYALGKEKALARLQEDHHCTLIDDTISELQNWCCFKAPQPAKLTQPAPPILTPPKPKKEKPAPRYSESRTGPKIGRNEPCPCGSGKKYKKCCGT